MIRDLLPTLQASARRTSRLRHPHDPDSYDAPLDDDELALLLDDDGHPAGDGLADDLAAEGLL